MLTPAHHLLYADDIIVSVNGHLRGLQCLEQLFLTYQRSAGQFYNQNKSRLFYGLYGSSEETKCNESLRHTGVFFFQKNGLGYRCFKVESLEHIFNL